MHETPLLTDTPPVITEPEFPPLLHTQTMSRVYAERRRARAITVLQIAAALVVALRVTSAMYRIATESSASAFPASAWREVGAAVLGIVLCRIWNSHRHHAMYTHRGDTHLRVISVATP
ncbi:hypothetical protein HYV74_00565 [Candidatus Uhrbacteria bacterium]|nr:hypothetical protein [Candidatus Uhrbacteria bacterium]